MWLKADIGAQTKGVYGSATNTTGAPILVVAGGAGDGVANVGKTIDRNASGNAESAKVQIAGLFSLADTETVSIAAEIQESDDDSTWDTAEALQASTVAATGETGGTNENFCVNLSVALKARKRYVRINFTPDCSAGSLDTGFATCVVTLGGGDVLPMT